ncbi:AmmeMemoRadiSam system radical SAM enzyme [Pontiellaceae bacterium B12227]|nr:AmmeMemoRadiSam system radical SAM enzyme [Pontiellaceae bacterium B12227]
MKAKVRCKLCPKGCELLAEQIGDCGVRKNIAGKIQCITYNHPSAIKSDPIEKKPLYHFLPGSEVLSIGTAGCNLHCQQCQNWQLSQESMLPIGAVSSAEITALAVKNKIQSIAYTYAEPLVSYEYTLECCQTSHQAGLKNILVSAAYINPAPLRTICDYLDAANIDLKSISDSFYRSICGAQLAPVLRALNIMKECGVYLELTNLIIPTLNDSTDETKKLCDWIVQDLGPETPLHFSRFFPQYKLKHLPATPKATIQQARLIAFEAGLKFVYTGNMADGGAGESTRCPECNTLLIQRRGYHVNTMRLVNGKCPDCGQLIRGIWN